ncbi:MAG: response regulator [Variovorax sp.]|jgi:signal transduction histidine kinase/ActR/RegA family two-component response regulator|nr:MAG: response regulator [Variovorax sp.]
MKKPAHLFHLSSLQARLGAMLAALVLGVSVVLAVLMATAAERQVLRQSAANLDVVSRQLARELATGMDGFAQAAVTQSLQDRFRNPASTTAAMRGALDDFLRANPAFAYAAVVDAGTARVLAASGGIFEGGDLSGRPSYEEGRRGLFVGDVHDAVRLAELLPPPGNGEKLRFLDASAPIRDDAGRIVRVFATHIGWQWTERLRNDIFGPLKTTHGVEALLVDSAGKVVLAATPDVPVGTVLGPAAGTPGEHARLIDWPDGRSYLTVSASTVPHGAFPGFGWRVVARQPAALATEAASHLRLAFVLAAITIGCGGALLAWWATGRLLLPVRQLGLHAGDTQWATAGAASTYGAATPSEVAGVRRAMARMARTTLDQTEARRLSERQFATLADSLPQRVFQTDPAGLVDYVNRAWVTAGVEAAGLLRHPLASLFHPASVATLEAAWRHGLGDGRPVSLRCLLQPAGETAARWYDVNARPLTDVDGGVRAWIGTLVDVHQIVVHAHDAEQALTQERTARAEAEKLGQLRDDFLATVSHELRSPLNVISGWSEILRRKGQDNPTALKAAEVIRTHARQQAALIDDLIDITAVTAGKMVLNLEPVDLAAVAAEVVSAQLPSAQLKGIALRCVAAEACVVRGDRRRVFQIVSNLVGNALKFTESGGSITVEVQRRVDHGALSVSDTGRGIDPLFLPHVFERMRQEDSSRTRRTGGLGLGLSIVQGLVALHEGTVTAASDGPGRGAVFAVALPLQAPTTATRTPQSAPSHDPDDAESRVVELRGCRVLLVDDEPDAREMAQVALNSLGAEVRVAGSGAEVLRILASETCDVLVSDIGMPEMDGLTLIRTIRRTWSADDLPAVALTAFAMECDRQAALAAGFQRHVTKPISLLRLSEAVAGVHADRPVTQDRGG